MPNQHEPEAKSRWVERDGWQALYCGGHEGRVRRVRKRHFELKINGALQRVTDGSDDLQEMKALVEAVILRLNERSPP